MREKYGNAFEVIFEKKFWPHIDGTGGFYVAKIRKLASLDSQKNAVNIEEMTEKEWKKSQVQSQVHNNTELRVFRGNISPWKISSDIVLYEHAGKILAIQNSEV